MRSHKDVISSEKPQGEVAPCAGSLGDGPVLTPTPELLVRGCPWGPGAEFHEHLPDLYAGGRSRFSHLETSPSRCPEVVQRPKDNVGRVLTAPAESVPCLLLIALATQALLSLVPGHRLCHGILRQPWYHSQLHQ